MNEVIPSPGTENNDWEEIKRRVELVKPYAKTIHIDVVDGKFTPNSTFADPAPFAEYTKDNVFEVHLMTDNPLQYLKSWADAGFTRFIGQVEMMPDPIEFIAQGQLLGAVGLAIDGPTSLDVLKDINLNDLDCLLIMTIKAGHSGQEFMPEILEKIKKIRSDYPYLTIEVDGGMNEKTIVETKEAGANKFIATSFIYGSENAEEALNRLTSLVM